MHLVNRNEFFFFEEYKFIIDSAKHNSKYISCYKLKQFPTLKDF